MDDITKLLGETVTGEDDHETVARALPRYRRVADQTPPMLLTARDRAIVGDVWHFRFLTTSQIATLRSHDPAAERRFVSRLTLTRRLKLLYHHRYLRRIPRPLAQGSREPVYVLDAEGARLLSLRHGEVTACPPSRLPRASALDHLLDIVQMRLSLTVARYLIPDDFRLREWRPGEKARFRVTVEEAGRRKSAVSIVPDGAATMRWHGLLQYAFVEMDRGTEPQRTIVAKARAYLAYWECGGFAADFTVQPGLGFRVFFVAPSARRAQMILKALGGLHDSRLFRITTLAEITPERVLEAVWWDGESGEQVRPFAD
jgi:hypothetical protein